MRCSGTARIFPSWWTSTAGTAGIVTIEDLIEEIVGEITDEYDAETPAPFSALPDGSYRVSARLPVEDLGELFDVELPDDDVDTVGGLLAQLLGRVPLPGSEASVSTLHLLGEPGVDRRGRPHVQTLLVRRLTPQELGLGDEDEQNGRRENGRSDKSDKADKSEKADRAERAEKADRADKAEKAERAEKAQKQERTDKAERAEKAAKLDKAERAAKAQKAAKADRSGGPDVPDRPPAQQQVSDSAAAAPVEVSSNSAAGGTEERNVAR